MVLREGGEEGTAERCPMQRKMHRPWDSQSYISLFCYFQARWPWEITFQGYHRTEVAYTNRLSHTLACSRCSVDSSDYTPGLWSDRVNPYLWFPFTLLSVLSTESLDHFFQEADIDFFHGRKQSSCIFARVVSMSATGLLIGGANVFPNLRRWWLECLALGYI